MVGKRLAEFKQKIILMMTKIELGLKILLLQISAEVFS